MYVKDLGKLMLNYDKTTKTPSHIKQVKVEGIYEHLTLAERRAHNLADWSLS